jgi:hypothetical protein
MAAFIAQNSSEHTDADLDRISRFILGERYTALVDRFALDVTADEDGLFTMDPNRKTGDGRLLVSISAAGPAELYYFDEAGLPTAEPLRTWQERFAYNIAGLPANSGIVLEHSDLIGLSQQPDRLATMSDEDRDKVVGPLIESMKRAWEGQRLAVYRLREVGGFTS